MTQARLTYLVIIGAVISGVLTIIAIQHTKIKKYEKEETIRDLKIQIVDGKITESNKLNKDAYEKFIKDINSSINADTTYRL